MTNLQTPPDEPYYQQPAQGDRRRWGSVLLVAGLVWLVFELTRQSLFGGLALITSEQDVADPPQSFSGATALTVETTIDNVALYHNDEAAITVESRRRGFGWNSQSARDALARVEVQVSREGERVTVMVLRPSGLSFGRTPTVDLRIGVPSGVDLQVRTVSGDITLEQVAGLGSLSTTSGTIEASATEGNLAFTSASGDIEVADHVGNPKLYSVSGDIELSGEGVNGTTIESISGDLTLIDVAGSVWAKSISGMIAIEAGRDMTLDIESTSGDIELSGSLAPRQAQRVHSVSGDIALELAEPLGLRLEATTLSGSLESDLELEQAIRERRRLSGSLGAGDTELQINTTSGDVSVDSEE
jgi:Putative adhesin